MNKNKEIHRAVNQYINAFWELIPLKSDANSLNAKQRIAIKISEDENANRKLLFRFILADSVNRSVNIICNNGINMMLITLDQSITSNLIF